MASLRLGIQHAHPVSNRLTLIPRSKVIVGREVSITEHLKNRTTSKKLNVLDVEIHWMRGTCWERFQVPKSPSTARGEGDIVSFVFFFSVVQIGFFFPSSWTVLDQFSPRYQTNEDKNMKTSTCTSTLISYLKSWNAPARQPPATGFAETLKKKGRDLPQGNSSSTTCHGIERIGPFPFFHSFRKGNELFSVLALYQGGGGTADSRTELSLAIVGRRGHRHREPWFITGWDESPILPPISHFGHRSQGLDIHFPSHVHSTKYIKKTRLYASL